MPDRMLIALGAATTVVGAGMVALAFYDGHVQRWRNAARARRRKGLLS